MWGSGLGSCIGLRPHVLLPTKTSQSWIQSIGSARVFSRMLSQVDFTLCIKALSRFITVAIILSSVSRLFMLLNHLVLISLAVCVFSWITCSHLRTQIRWVDSVRSICSSLAVPAPMHVSQLFSSFGLGRLFLSILPHPRMIPSDISGHRGFSWGQ